MLVLSRKLNETIVIDGDIRITIVGIRGNQVRLGIEAPERVGIFREELCAGIAVEGRSETRRLDAAPSVGSAFKSTGPSPRVPRRNGARSLTPNRTARFEARSASES